MPTQDDGQGEERSRAEIDDEADWLPPDHRREVQPGPLPSSLLESLRWFLLTCAIRDLRDARGDPHRGGGIHRSMLVNVSRFTSVQDHVADDIRLELERIQLSVRHHGAKPPSQAEASSEDIRQLRETFARHGAGCGFDWGDVLGSLHESIAPVQVQPINQRTGSSALDYGSIKTAPGVRVIAVGGNSLSRGITLEGLTVNYFLRNSKAYDTLLQMGRWFGYRDGYADLCRIWLTPEAEGWYRHITLATTELKREFRRMRQQRATPRDFGLRVRTHPDTLIITARNKMATGMDVVASVQAVSLDGMGIETARVHRRRSHNEDNLRLIERFLTRLMETRGRPESVRGDGAYLWQDVPGQEIANLIEDFLVHPLNHDFRGDNIAEDLRDAASAEEHSWSKWKVALPRQGDDDLPKWILHGPYTLEVRAKRRRILIREDTRPPSILLSGRSARVGSQRDVLYGLSQAEQEEAKRRAREEAPDGRRGVPEGICRAVMRVPLLVLFLVRGELEKGGEAFDDGLILPALGLHFPGKVNPEARKRYVRYRLNRVAQAELDLGDDDIPADDDIDD